MDIHEAWVKGKSFSEIARVTGRDRNGKPTSSSLRW